MRRGCLQRLGLSRCALHTYIPVALLCSQTPRLRGKSVRADAETVHASIPETICIILSSKLHEFARPWRT